MSKRYWCSFLIFGVFLIGLQACGRQFNPQEACNFVQSANLQRVSWKKGLPVKLLVHNSVPVEAYEAIERGIYRWNAALGKEMLKIEAWGVGGSSQPAQDGYNMIYWMSDWEDSRSTEQARTTIYWHGDQIFEADLRINAKNYRFFTAKESSANTKVDLESLVLHEAGHILGLAHNQQSGSVMNVSLASGQFRRNPELTDLDSLRCEY